MAGLARATHTRRVWLVGTGPWRAAAVASNQANEPRMFGGVWEFGARLLGGRVPLLIMIDSL
eukprot:scaffold20908_cov60-Phaeocystis_antarctica.AAC.2